MAHDVFISYSARDKAVADAVCASLEGRKVRCWIAPRDVPPGQTWVGALVEAIGESRVFVLVFSNGSNNSPQVLREVGEAVDRGIPIIPFRIEDVQPSKEMAYYIKALHWLDAMTPPLEKHLQRLGDTVQALLGVEGPQRPAVETAEAKVAERPVRREPVRRSIWWPWGALFILLVVLGCTAVGIQVLRRGLTAPTPTPIAQISQMPTPTHTALPPPVQPRSATDTPWAPATHTPPWRPMPSPLPTVPDAVGGEFVLVPDELVGEIFAPGPQPVALAVMSDTLWVADGQQNLLYQLDDVGEPLATFPIDLSTTILGNHRSDCNPVDGTTWEYRGDFLLKYSADAVLLQTLYAPIFGGAEGLAWAPDGLWVVSIFGQWYRIGFDGRELDSGHLRFGAFPFYPKLAFDERGYLWLTLQDDRKIYQLSLRQEEVRPGLPAVLPGQATDLVLPRPQVRPAAITDTAVVRITNGLKGTMTLSFGEHSAIVKADDTWSAELQEGVYTVYASANVPEPIAFSAEELLVEGYEFVWVLSRPE